MTVLAFIIGLLVILVGLAVSIAWHELGHLIPAKLFGVRVGQYMIGFGPTLWSRRKGETEYGFKAFPVGGYISMAGMYPPSPKQAARNGAAGGGFFATMVQDARSANDETLEAGDDRTFYRLPMYKRIIIMLGGPVMNLILAVIIFTIVLSGFGIQQATTTLATVQPCVTTASACAATDPESPAHAAGLEAGDTITAIDGTAVSTFAEMSEIIAASPEKTLTLTVERDGTSRTVEVTPRLGARTVTNADGTTTTEKVGLIGVNPTSRLTPQPLWAGPQLAIENTGQVMAMIVQLPQKLAGVAVSLFTGSERDPNGPLSVVGVGVIAGEVAATDAPIATRVSAMLSLVGSLNIALFVFNLIPLLPLDGGHVAVALWDGIKRGWAKLFGRAAPKPTDATRLVPLTFVVVVVLIVMGALLLVADLVNPVKLF
ncbi:M50 family metallopeptidase [Microbacterium gorillae]|uniref:M50 family metallopeptidase n=1 Tax=Microbacterium gorillae TaxID=1231063 RepID=UPI00059157C1|nr:M50 family metallopeptidase [Microbacterium gorillae]